MTVATLPFIPGHSLEDAPRLQHAVSLDLEQLFRIRPGHARHDVAAANVVLGRIALLDLVTGQSNHAERHLWTELDRPGTHRPSVNARFIPVGVATSGPSAIGGPIHRLRLVLAVNQPAARPQEVEQRDLVIRELGTTMTFERRELDLGPPVIAENHREDLVPRLELR